MAPESSFFWIALLQIIGVNIVLSGDNAVVIALAARGLPLHQQKKAVVWGSGAAVVMRIVLTIAAVEMLRFPYLKLVGSALLLWIAVKLLIPEEEDGGDGAATASMAAAIKTILIADLAMSLDNVIAVAAAAKGNTLLLILGLAISIPIVVFASQILLKLMDRFPFIITGGAALLGWVAGEMAVTDSSVSGWVDVNAKWLHFVAPAAGAALVVALGKWFSSRAEREAAKPAPAPAAELPAKLQRVLLAVDGSENSDRAARYLLQLRGNLRAGETLGVELINVQRPVSGDVATFVPHATLEEYHRENSEKAMASARAILAGAGIKAREHQRVGAPGAVIAGVAADEKCDLIVMGTRGLATHTGALLGSVAQGTLENSKVPVLLVT